MAQGHAIQLVPLDLDGDSDVPHSKPSGGESSGSAVVPPSDQSTGNVDKIRDILFGAHMREYGNRFARLEENLLKEAAGIRDDTKKRFDALEAFVRNQFEALQERLKNERDERAGSLRQVARDLSELEGTFTQRFNELNEQTSQADRHLRLELLQQSKEFTEDLRRKQDETATLVERRFQELHRGKTDRAALAGLFTELAMRLNDEFQIPGAEG
jgi:hypothetical protein